MIVLCSEPVDEPLLGRDELVFASAAQLAEAEQRLKDGRFGRLQEAGPSFPETGRPAS